MANDHLAACRHCGPQFRSQLYENETRGLLTGRPLYIVGCRHCGRREVGTTRAEYARQRWNREQQQ